MTCYTRIIKNKTHSQVLAVIKDVADDKKSADVAAKELNLTKHEFKELYDDIISKILIAA